MNNAPLVLIVDDMPINRLALVLLLRNRGFATQEACNGIEAIERLKTSSYTAILMDYNMPKMDGLECTKQIRELEADKGKHTPIIGMTASNERNIEELCIGAGMDSYLTKDSSDQEIEDAIVAVLSKSAAA
jgi:CheY-like chemotaxis protein